jgi:hypothetical protein
LILFKLGVISYKVKYCNKFKGEGKRMLESRPIKMNLQMFATDSSDTPVESVPTTSTPTEPTTSTSNTPVEAPVVEEPVVVVEEIKPIEPVVESLKEPIVEPVVEPVLPVEPEKVIEVTVEELQSKLDLTVEKSTVELNKANTLLNLKTEQVNEYEGILNALIDSKMEGIPENLKELIPEKLSLVEKMAWIDKAEKTGIFNTGNPDGIEIGKPFNPSTKNNTNTSDMSASAKMALAYGTSKVGRKK